LLGLTKRQERRSNRSGVAEMRANDADTVAAV
jgi:hypothetical protein